MLLVISVAVALVVLGAGGLSLFVRGGRPPR